MKKYPEELKQEAIRLRVEKFLGLRLISSTLGVALGTASLWLKNYPLPKELVLERLRKTVSSTETRKKCKDTWRFKFDNTSFEDLSLEGKRLRVFEDQKYTCIKCKLNEWMQSPITLELEHKDGNNRNNVRSNLEALCPNCHSMTNTWRGRNKSRGGLKIRVSDEDLINSLKTEPNISQALIKVGLTPKGSNYARANQLINFDTNKVNCDTDQPHSPL